MQKQRASIPDARLDGETIEPGILILEVYMSRNLNTIWCDGCGEEIIWMPLIVSEHHYCCSDCSNGLPCKCYRWSEIDLNRREESNISSFTDDYFLDS